MKRVKSKLLRAVRLPKPRGIQSTIMYSFSVISVSLMLIIALVLYLRFSTSSRQETIQSTQRLREQT